MVARDSSILAFIARRFIRPRPCSRPDTLVALRSRRNRLYCNYLHPLHGTARAMMTGSALTTS